MNRTEQNRPCRLRLFLRDHRVLEANARVPEGQTLATYLGSRSRFANLTEIDWLGSGDRVSHLALKVDTILWAAAADGDLPLSAGPIPDPGRRVDVELEGGYVIGAGLLLPDDERLTDYLQSAPTFVPLREAELRPRDKTLGDIVVNRETIQMVREPGADAPPYG